MKSLYQIRTMYLYATMREKNIYLFPFDVTMENLNPYIVYFVYVVYTLIHDVPLKYNMEAKARLM